MEESRGLIMYNCGTKCVVRAIVCLYSIRKYYNGDITFFIEDNTTPKEFDEVCKYFNVNVVKLPDDPSTGALIKKTRTLWETPYDRTLWVDADMIITGKIDEMFDYLDQPGITFAIPHFCRWVSDGKGISRRIKRFENIVSKEMLDEAMNHHPAINTGIFSYRNKTKFMREWIDLALQTNGKRIFISDEIACQILLPQFKNEIYITDPKFNVSVLYGNDIEDKRVVHFHGSKHVLQGVKLCDDIWKPTFKEMCDNNIANINSFLKYSDKRLSQYLKGEKQDIVEDEYIEDVTKIDDKTEVKKLRDDVTICTACDEYYVDILRETYANWRKYKDIDTFPVIVFVHGMDVNTDSRLDFLRLPNVKMVPWKMDNVDGNHREEMLSAFVFGAAENVKTEYWLKLDADSFATDNRPFITDEMKTYSLFSHKWGYTKPPEYIKRLDEWAKNHWKRKLRLSQPMIEQGKIQGNRFYHNNKRIISYICLQKTQFTRFCVKLLKERRLPAPTQDTYAYFVIQKFNPEAMGIGNFKRHYGFNQGRGKLGAEVIRKQLMEIDRINAEKSVESKEKQGEPKNNTLPIFSPTGVPEEVGRIEI